MFRIAADAGRAEHSDDREARPFRETGNTTVSITAPLEKLHNTHTRHTIGRHRPGEGEADISCCSELRRAAGDAVHICEACSTWHRVEVTGSAQKLGQLEAVNRD
jgi:hypothetical protein